MGIPPEIRKLLGTREASAHASLSCGLRGPIGETHLVVADGQLFVFERESLIGEYTRVELAAVPVLEQGDFTDTLHLLAVDGSDAELTVTSFEREAVASVLAAAAKPAPPPAACAARGASGKPTASNGFVGGRGPVAAATGGAGPAGKSRPVVATTE